MGCRGSWLVITGGGIWIREFSSFLRLVSLARWATPRPALLLLAGKGKGKWGGRKAEESKGVQKPQLTNTPTRAPRTAPPVPARLRLARGLPGWRHPARRRRAEGPVSGCHGRWHRSPLPVRAELRPAGRRALNRCHARRARVAMCLVGVTDLARCHPGLVSTLEIDHLVPSIEGHPHARARARL